MEKKEYMTVGEMAKRMGTTVRTLQYYDREGLLPPSAESGGGRRLYTCKDMVRLHQIQALKSLGFSLSDIKNKLIPLEAPGEVEKLLLRQEQAVREQIGQLTETLGRLQALRKEAAQMRTVDFRKYADIIANLQLHNENYWLIKYFDGDTLDHIRSRFDRESGAAFMERFRSLNARALKLREQKAAPESASAQALAEEFWGMVMEFTNGNLEMLPELMRFGEILEEHGGCQKSVNEYLQPALELYFQRTGICPFGEGTV